MRAITVKLPNHLDESLIALARQRNTSRSALIREALERLTDTPRISILARAADLVGSLDGPGDLSTNPRYMDGYGE